MSLPNKPNNESFIKNIIIIILILLFLFSLIRIKRIKDSRERLETALKASTDSIIVWKTKEGINKARIGSIIETEAEFIETNYTQKDLKELQGVVKENKGRLGQSGTVIVVGGNTKFDTVLKKETIKEIGFNSLINNKYIKLSSSTDSINTKLSLKVINDYSVVIGEESQGWFKPKKPFAEVTNKNPYTETTTLRTFEVKQPPKPNFGIGPMVGYGVGNGITPTVFIGIGVQYNLIKF